MGHPTQPSLFRRGRVEAVDVYGSVFFFSSRRRHTRCSRDWSSDVCSSDLSAPYALRDMGSFHVGGRDVEITGKPVKEVVFTPGGVPAKVDLNGAYSVEAM